jgi:GntR family transcriptional regulator/MocR family aminotransferase
LGITAVPTNRIRAGVQRLADLIREKVSRGYDPARLAPSLLTGEALRATMAGATLLCKTVYGAPCTIELRADGAMVGRAGYAHEERDEGRWWVEGALWFRQWRHWAYGEASAYRPLIEGGRVQWLNEDGVALDWAVYVPSGAAADAETDLAPLNL